MSFLTLQSRLKASNVSWLVLGLSWVLFILKQTQQGKTHMSASSSRSKPSMFSSFFTFVFEYEKLSAHSTRQLLPVPNSRS